MLIDSIFTSHVSQHDPSLGFEAKWCSRADLVWLAFCRIKDDQASKDCFTDKNCWTKLAKGKGAMDLMAQDCSQIKTAACWYQVGFF
jgi:hypothetical protein